jgi:hypothetical protein
MPPVAPAMAPPPAAQTMPDTRPSMPVGVPLDPTQGGTPQGNSALPQALQQSLAAMEAQKAETLGADEVRNAREASIVIPSNGQVETPPGQAVYDVGSFEAWGPKQVPAPSSPLPNAVASVSNSGNPDMLWAGKAALNPYGAEMAKDVWKANLRSTTGYGLPMSVKEFNAYKAMSKEDRDMFDKLKRADPMLKLGDFVQNARTGERYKVNMSPDQYQNRITEIIKLHNSPDAINGYMQSVGGDPVAAKRLQEENIMRAIEQIGGAPGSSAAPAAAAAAPAAEEKPVTGANFSNAELNVIGDMKRKGMSDHEIMQNLNMNFGSGKPLPPDYPGRPDGIPMAAGRATTAPPMANPNVVAQQQAMATQTGKDMAGMEQKERDRLTMAPKIAAGVADMRNGFEELKKNGGISSTGAGTPGNLRAYVETTGIGTEASRALGAKNQAERDKIDAARARVISMIKRASGANSKEIDSNKELEFFMSQSGNNKYSYEANMAILRSLMEQYAPELLPDFESSMGLVDGTANPKKTPTYEEWKAMRGK